MDKHCVIIVTYNRLALLKKCVAAVLAQTRPYDHVVIVDNASTDGTKEYLGTLRKRNDFTIIRMKRNIGGAGGFERGMREGTRLGADWMTIIDDDSVMRKNFLEEICKAMLRTDGRYAAYAGVPLTDGIRPGHRRRITGALIQKEKAVPKAEYKKEFFLCDIASFCGLVVAGSAVKKVGYPRRDFFIWYDDTEFCLRLSRITPILNWNSAIIDHRAKIGEATSVADWKDYYGIRNRIVVTKEHYTRLTLFTVVAKKGIKAIISSATMAMRGQAAGVPGQLTLYYDAILDGLADSTGYCRKYGPS